MADDDASSTPDIDVDGVNYEQIEGFLDRHGFLSWLGISLEAAERGRVVMKVPFDEKLLNLAPDGQRSIHGGIAATMVDTASGFALRTAFEDPTTAGLTTTDLNVSYLRPATDDLFVEAEVVRAGTSVGVAEATVESTKPDGERTEVAVGRATYRLFRKGGT